MGQHDTKWQLVDSLAQQEVKVKQMGHENSRKEVKVQQANIAGIDILLY